MELSISKVQDQAYEYLTDNSKLGSHVSMARGAVENAMTSAGSWLCRAISNRYLFR